MHLLPAQKVQIDCLHLSAQPWIRSSETLVTTTTVLRNLSTLAEH
jgi:hypothetical protein